MRGSDIGRWREREREREREGQRMREGEKEREKDTRLRFLHYFLQENHFFLEWWVWDIVAILCAECTILRQNGGAI